ncbi:hypothetical protein ABG067_002022 [Albugo candida]
MTLFSDPKQDFQDCIHCLPYKLGPTRLTPTTYSGSVANYKAIGSQYFFKSASSYCLNENLCTTMNVYNIINIDEAATDSSPIQEKISDQPHEIVCLVNSRPSMNVLCETCLKEASRTQYFGHLNMLTGAYSDDNAMLVMFSERTQEEISKSCVNHCGSNVMFLESPLCSQLLTNLLQEEKAQMPDSRWLGVTNQEIYITQKSSPILSIPKVLLRHLHCLTTKHLRLDAFDCQKCLARLFKGLIVAVTTAKLGEDTNVHHVIHIFGTVKEIAIIKKQCALCEQVGIMERNHPACRVQFRDIFVKPQVMNQISAKYMETWKKNTSELTSLTVESECIWASKVQGASNCGSCLKQTSLKVMELSQHATLATVSSNMLKSSVAQCIDESKCDQVVFIPLPLCNYENLLEKETDQHVALTRNTSSGSVSNNTRSRKTQLRNVLYKKTETEISSIQDPGSPKRWKVDSLSFDLNIPASTMDHEKVAVVHWRSEKPGKCLECLAIKESVIMISIKRSYAWVIDDDANYFKTGWMCPHCTSLRKRYPLVLDKAMVIAAATA